LKCADDNAMRINKPFAYKVEKAIKRKVCAWL